MTCANPRRFAAPRRASGQGVRGYIVAQHCVDRVLPGQRVDALHQQGAVSLRSGLLDCLEAAAVAGVPQVAGGPAGDHPNPGAGMAEAVEDLEADGRVAGVQYDIRARSVPLPGDDVLRR